MPTTILHSNKEEQVYKKAIMAEHIPRYQNESPNSLKNRQIDHLSGMLVLFHLQYSPANDESASDEKNRNFTGSPPDMPVSTNTRTISRTQSNSKPKKKQKKIYRNPVIYAKELNEEMTNDNLTRKQLAERHGISSDRVTQWLCLLNLPDKLQQEVIAMGDFWDRKKISERFLRNLRLKG